MLLYFSILFGMKALTAQCRRPQRGGFFRGSMLTMILAMILVGIYALLYLIQPMDPRSKEVDRLAEEYNKAQWQLVASIVADGPQDPIAMIKNHYAAEAALKRLRNAVEATPPEYVPPKAWKIVKRGS